MTIKAKPVLKDRFWIVEDNGEKIGTMSLSDDRYMFASPIETCFFDNKRQITKKFSQFIWGDEEVKPITEEKYLVQGYPTSVKPYNEMYDVNSSMNSKEYIANTKLSVYDTSTPQQNKLVLINGLQYHASSTPVKTGRRLAINFNYR